MMSHLAAKHSQLACRLQLPQRQAEVHAVAQRRQLALRGTNAAQMSPDRTDVIDSLASLQAREHETSACIASHVHSFNTV